MRHKIIEHLSSILFIGLIFLLIQALWGPAKKTVSYQYLNEIKAFMLLDFLDLSNPEDRLLLHETLNYYYPGEHQRHDSLMTEIAAYVKELMLADTGPHGGASELNFDKLLSLSEMLVKFILIYVLVLLLTSYGVETFAVYRFIRLQQPGSLFEKLRTTWQKLNHATGLRERSRFALIILRKILRGLIKGMVMLILFAPAYVIAYSFKTRFDTDSVILMVLLGVISNGLLITYTQKYFTFLVSESRKGYVQTARVKNLKHDYRFSAEKGIRLSTIFKIRKTFPGHVFGHIYQNVRFQYLHTLKEQASFLITGLIIIEMALNIQGHLCYELMQNILYKNLAIVLLIVFGIFVVVKLTEMTIDYLVFSQQQKIDNKP